MALLAQREHDLRQVGAPHPTNVLQKGSSCGSGCGSLVKWSRIEGLTGYPEQHVSLFTMVQHKHAE